jgi:hypothetical protein
MALGKKKVIAGAFFVSITASTDLFTRWISKL